MFVAVGLLYNGDSNPYYTNYRIHHREYGNGIPSNTMRHSRTSIHWKHLLVGWSDGKTSMIYSLYIQSGITGTSKPSARRRIPVRVFLLGCTLRNVANGYYKGDAGCLTPRNRNDSNPTVNIAQGMDFQQFVHARTTTRTVQLFAGSVMQKQNVNPSAVYTVDNVSVRSVHHGIPYLNRRRYPCLCRRARSRLRLRSGQHTTSQYIPGSLYAGEYGTYKNDGQVVSMNSDHIVVKWPAVNSSYGYESPFTVACEIVDRKPYLSGGRNINSGNPYPDGKIREEGNDNPSLATASHQAVKAPFNPKRGLYLFG